MSEQAEQRPSVRSNTNSKVFTYTIHEELDGQDGVDYDKHTETITIVVTDLENGKLDVKINDGDATYTTPAFVNTYTASGKAQLYDRAGEAG